MRSKTLNSGLSYEAPEMLALEQASPMEVICSSSTAEAETVTYDVSQEVYNW